MLTLSIAVNCRSQSSGAAILWQLSSVQRWFTAIKIVNILKIKFGYMYV